MSNFSDATLIEGLKNNDFKVLDYIYALNLPKVTKMVKQNKGTENDARDVFQEAIVLLFKRFQENDFKLNSSFSNYLYGICKFMWLRQLKKKYRTEVTLGSDEGLQDEESFEQEIFALEQRQFYQKKFGELSAECQQVLQLFFDGNPLKKIAETMGYTDVYVKRKKYKCKEKLVSLVQNDQRFSEYQ